MGDFGVHKKHGLKMNPNKCAFGVSDGQFLGFMAHERGIEIGQKKYESNCWGSAPDY